jgi:hypothetical protein
MTTLTKSAFAKQQGWSPSYVTKLNAQGRLVLDDAGKVIVQASLDKIKATAGARDDVSARNASERKAVKRGKKQIPVDLNIPLEDLPEGSRAKYKAVAMHYQNQLQKLNMALMQSLRFDNRAVRDEAAGIGNTLRAAIERLIDTTAPRLAIAKTREERERILLAEITAMRKTIKNTFPRAMLRLAKQKHG